VGWEHKRHGGHRERLVSELHSLYTSGPRPATRPTALYTVSYINSRTESDCTGCSRTCMHRNQPKRKGPLGPVPNQSSNQPNRTQISRIRRRAGFVLRYSWRLTVLEWPRPHALAARRLRGRVNRTQAALLPSPSPQLLPSLSSPRLPMLLSSAAQLRLPWHQSGDWRGASSPSPSQQLASPPSPPLVFVIATATLRHHSPVIAGVAVAAVANKAVLPMRYRATLRTAARLQGCCREAGAVALDSSG
jgi:hypothetical protein